MSITGDENDNNFKGKTNIPNYSVFTLEIVSYSRQIARSPVANTAQGNTTFRNYLLNQEVGTVFIDNMVLYPGEKNEFPMRATINNGPVLEALGKKPYCDETKGVLPFVLSGKTVVNNGKPLSYYADALASHNQTIEIDVGTPVAKLLGRPVECAKTK